MKRKQRTKICVHCDDTLLHAWARQCMAQATFNTLKDPAEALTMIKMRESAQHTLFYLGELLVTETRVECNGQIGIGIVQGEQYQKSFDMAIIDAAFHANIAYCEELEKELLKEEQHQQVQRQKEIAMILKTRVNFETMDGKADR